MSAPLLPGRVVSTGHGVWTQAEHDRFLQALRLHPRGPWKSIAAIVGTRSVRQVQTHAQKYNEKVMRRLGGANKDRKTWAREEHRVDDDVLSFCVKRASAINTSDGAGNTDASANGARRAGRQSAQQHHQLDEQQQWSEQQQQQQKQESLSLEPFEDSDDAALREALVWTKASDLDARSSLSPLPTLEESLDFLITHLLDDHLNTDDDNNRSSAP